MGSSEKLLQRRVGPCSMLDAIMAVIISIAVIVTVICIVTITLSDTSTKEEQQHVVSDEHCLDVAVIGAGIGGTYTAWRLSDRNLSVSLFEYSDRVGGRLFSAKLFGSVVEFGGMRYLPKSHHILNSTIHELNLTAVPFTPGLTAFPERLWYVRGEHWNFQDFMSTRVPYRLEPQEKKMPARYLWDAFSQNTNMSGNTSLSVDEMYSLYTNDGIPLFTMSLDNFYGRYLSGEAVRYFRDSSGWGLATGPGSIVTGFALTAFPGNPTLDDVLMSVKEGMNQVPKRLAEKFLRKSNRHKLHLNQQLMGVKRRQDGGYTLHFQGTSTTQGITQPLEGTTSEVCAKKVILAIQKTCIEAVDIPFFHNNQQIVETLDSVYDHPAGKVFLAYSTPWWKTNFPGISHTKTDLPNLQTWDWRSDTDWGTNVSIIIASYNDGDSVHYWRELSKFGTPIKGSLPGVNAVTDVVKERLEQYLSSIYNFTQADIPEALGGGMMLWDTYPFTAAWTLFKPGADARKVIPNIPKPSSRDHVYIVGNSWSVESGWSEDTLESSDAVINKYFN